MRRFVVLVLLFCMVALGIEAQEVQKWAIMVEKAELYSEPNVTSPIKGYVSKSDVAVIGELNKDGSWLHVKRSANGVTGWVMSCVCVDATQANNTYGFDYETCYKINKELAEGKISQERFGAMLTNLQNYRDVNYGMSRFKEDKRGSLQERWIFSAESIDKLNIAIIILILGAAVGYILYRFFGIYITFLNKGHIIALILGIIQVLYVLHPYGVSNFKMINALALIAIQFILIKRGIYFRGLLRVKPYAIATLGCIAVAAIIYICKVGIVETVSILFESIVGAILNLVILGIIGVIVYGYFTAPSSSSSADSPEELPEVCKFCKHFDRTSGVCYMDIDNPKRKNPNHDTCSRFDWY